MYVCLSMQTRLHKEMCAREKEGEKHMHTCVCIQDIKMKNLSIILCVACVFFYVKAPRSLFSISKQNQQTKT